MSDPAMRIFIQGAVAVFTALILDSDAVLAAGCVYFVVCWFQAHNATVEPMEVHQRHVVKGDMTFTEATAELPATTNERNVSSASVPTITTSLLNSLEDSTFEQRRDTARKARKVPGVFAFSVFDMRRQRLAEEALPALRKSIEVEYGRDPEVLQFLSDPACFRYLRAREGNVVAAMKMIRTTVEWRTKKDMFHQELRCQVCEQKDPKAHAYFFIGCDTFDRAVMYSCSARANDHTDTNSAMNHMVAEMEHFLDDAKGIAQVVWVVDFNGFRAKHSNPELGKLATQIFQQVYPERLGQLVLLDFPWLFSIFFKIISPMLDPVTRSKILILKSKQDQVKYFRENWSPDMVDWISNILEMPALPGVFPDSAIVRSRYWR